MPAQKDQFIAEIVGANSVAKAIGVVLKRDQDEGDRLSLSDEERLAILSKVLPGVDGERYKLLLTDDELYIPWDSSVESLHRIGYILMKHVFGNELPHLVLDFYNPADLDNKISAPGFYLLGEDNEPRILINIAHRENYLECAGILAHELMHLCLEQHGLRLTDRDQNEKLVDMATIHSGLGLAVLNAYAHEENNWLITLVALAAGVLHYRSSSKTFGYYKPHAYGELFTKWMRDLGLNVKDIVPWLQPYARTYVPGASYSAIENRERTRLMGAIEKEGRKSWFKGTALALVGFGVILAIGFFVGGGEPTLPPDMAQMKTQIEENQNRLSELEGRMRALDSPSTYSEYNRLVPTYNGLLDATKKMIEDYNNKVDEYNKTH